MPQLGETVTEGTVTKWYKAVGDQVARDEPLFEVSTDKVDSEVPSPAEGVLTAILVEPLVQGAGGMVFHPPETLRLLREAADLYGLPLIFDEIFTGFGRTGTMFAHQQAGITPDIITLSKALTGGTIPLAATIANGKIVAQFLSDDPKKALMHGPTFMANPLACAAANASLDLFETLAALKAALLEQGIWVRPFRDIVYLTPAFSIEADQLSRLTRGVFEVLRRP